MLFHQLDSTGEIRGWGLSAFNASLAKNVSLVLDQLLQAELNMFLFDLSHAVDITPRDLRSIPCAGRVGSSGQQKRQRSYFVPGGVEHAISNPLNDTDALSSEAIVAENQQ